MKRALISISAVVALVPGPAAAQSVGAYSVDYVEANANWVSGGDRRTPFFRFVSVTRDTQPTDAPFTTAEIGKVRCRSWDDRKSFRYSCVVSGRIAFIRSGGFQFDAALRSARASFTAFGRSNVVEWTGRGQLPQRESSLHGGERAIVASAALRTGAKVRGRVLGRAFSTKKSNAQAALRRGTEAGVIYDTGVRSFSVARETESAAWSALRRAITRL